MNILKILQLIISVLLIICVLIQTKNAGLTSAVKSSFSAYRSLRGVEKVVFWLTVFLSVALVANSLLLITLS